MVRMFCHSLGYFFAAWILSGFPSGQEMNARGPVHFVRQWKELHLMKIVQDNIPKEKGTFRGHIYLSTRKGFSCKV